MSEQRIVIDSREPIELMEPLLQELGFETVVKEMTAPDYVIPLKNGYNIAITMKSYDDFIQSVHSGHMHAEIERMLQLPPKTMIFLFMWKPNYTYSRGQMFQAMEMADTINNEYIPVVKVGNRIKSAETMKKIYQKYIKEENPMQFRRRVELSGNKKTDPTVRLYMNLPGIGSLVAKEMKKVYPNMSLLVDAVRDTRVHDLKRWKTKKEWQVDVWYNKIDKLGFKKAEKIQEILCDGLG